MENFADPAQKVISVMSQDSVKNVEHLCRLRLTSHLGRLFSIVLFEYLSSVELPPLYIIYFDFTKICYIFLMCNHVVRITEIYIRWQTVTDVYDFTRLLGLLRILGVNRNDALARRIKIIRSIRVCIIWVIRLTRVIRVVKFLILFMRAKHDILILVYSCSTAAVFYHI